MSENLQSYARRISPFWLKNKQIGQAFVDVLARPFDTVLQATHDTVALKTALHCPYDALPVIAAERKMFRSPTETDEEFRNQLRKAVYWHSMLGQARCLPLQFARCKLATTSSAGLSVSSFRNSQMTSMPDYNAANWARLWLVVQMPHPFIESILWTDGEVWTSAKKWTLKDDSDHAATISWIKTVIENCLSPHIDLRGVYVSMDENGLGPVDASWDGTLNFAGRTLVKII